jgi:hypothetical protein
MGIGPLQLTNFGEIKDRIQDFVPELGTDTIGRIIANKYRSLLKSWQWSFLKGNNKNLNLIGPYIMGTVSVNNGSVDVTGVGTGWTADMAGRFIRLGNVPYAFYQIQGITDSTHLKLLQAYGGASVSGQSYTMFQFIYSLGVDVREIMKITYDVALSEKSVEYFDRRDPYRTESGTPMEWADRGLDSNGFRLIEIFPVPSSNYVCKYDYWKGITDLKDDKDVILIRDDLLQEASLVDLYRIASNINSFYKTNMAESAVIYKQLWMDAIEEDNRKASAEFEVRDYTDDELVGDDWLRNHYIGDTY